MTGIINALHFASFFDLENWITSIQLSFLIKNW